MKEKIIELVYNLASRPAWVTKKDINALCDGTYLDIIMFGDYHITLNFDVPMDDSAFCDGGGAYGKKDLEYAVEIMDNRKEILSIAEEWFNIVREAE